MANLSNKIPWLLSRQGRIQSEKAHDRSATAREEHETREHVLHAADRRMQAGMQVVGQCLYGGVDQFCSEDEHDAEENERLPDGSWLKYGKDGQRRHPEEDLDAEVLLRLPGEGDARKSITQLSEKMLVLHFARHSSLGDRQVNPLMFFLCQIMARRKSTSHPPWGSSSSPASCPRSSFEGASLEHV